MESTRHLGLWSGVGIVVANMIGAGVFLSAGFMAQDMGPGLILGAWVVGAVLALSGARAYAAVAALVPRSGGEYRYLSELLHPSLGYLAGWASLLLGFSMPIALDALAAGAFAKTLFPAIGDPRHVGAALIVVLVLLQAVELRTARRSQNLLVGVKAVLVVGFVVVGVGLGRHGWPTWHPPHEAAGFPLEAFMANLFWIAYAFSGWNAAVYASEEFRDPGRDVPRAMLIGCGLVAALYLLVNWVFVANLTPARAAAVFDYEQTRITLGHLVTTDLLGAAGGKAMSALALVAFVSAMSAMTLAGPRVYAAMARDGFLPAALAGKAGRPPAGSVILQGAIALAVLYTHRIQEVLQNVAAVLVLFSALTALSLFRVALAPRRWPRPPASSLVAAALYVLSAAWMLYFGLKSSYRLLAWVGLVAVVALAAYAITRLLRRRRYL